MADGTIEVAEHGAEAAAPGMPQLDFTTFPNQIFWLIVALVAIYWILSRIALPRIGAVLAERSGTITNDIGVAEELRLKAAEAEAAYEKALADARAEANRIVAETRAAIQADLDAELARADAEIAARSAESEQVIAGIRDQAVQSVTAVARDTAREIVAVLGFTVEPEAVDAAVAERVKG